MDRNAEIEERPSIVQRALQATCTSCTQRANLSQCLSFNIIIHEFHIEAHKNSLKCAVAMTNNDWCVAVFKCSQENIRNVLVEFYGFMRDVEGVKSLHFLIRDRVENEVIVSFRVLSTEKTKEIVRSKMNYKLETLVPGKFTVDPDIQNPLNKYVAWGNGERMSKLGVDKFPEFCGLLSKMSGLVIEMLKNDYFETDERVEIAHLMSWMLGCTEYGKLSPAHMEVGYYDRIEDKCYQCLREDFPKK